MVPNKILGRKLFQKWLKRVSRYIFFQPVLSKKVQIKDRHVMFLGTDIEMKVIVNENVENPIELETDAEASPKELQPLETLLANETSTDVEAKMNDPEI